MDSSAPTETELESTCRAVTMGTGWHWPWVMFTEGERIVIFPALRVARAERNWDFLERSEEGDVERGFMLDADADAEGKADGDGKCEARLDGDARRECTVLGDDGACARFPDGCLREETIKVSSSTSRISLGHSL